MKLRVTLPVNVSTVPDFLNFTNSLLMLFFVQPLSGNSAINYRALYSFYGFLIKILSSLLNGVKVAAFA